MNVLFKTSFLLAMCLAAKSTFDLQNKTLYKMWNFNTFGPFCRTEKFASPEDISANTSINEENFNFTIRRVLENIDCQNPNPSEECQCNYHHNQPSMGFLSIKANEDPDPGLYVYFDHEHQEPQWSCHVHNKRVLEPGSYSKNWSSTCFDSTTTTSIDAAYRIGRSVYRVDKTQLAPEEDFYIPWQKSVTYHYLNCAPMKNILKNRNWKLLETVVRDIEEPLVITTGALGFEVYLSREVRVSSYLFKIVQFRDWYLNKLVDDLFVFVGVNDVEKTSEDLCRNVCHLVPFVDAETRNQFGEKENGRIYCCRFADFLHALYSRYLEFFQKISPRDLLCRDFFVDTRWLQ